MKNALVLLALLTALALIGFLYFQNTQLEQAIQLSEKRFADCEQVNFQLQMQANGRANPAAEPAVTHDVEETPIQDLLSPVQLGRLVSRGLTSNPAAVLRTSLERQQQRLLPAEGKVAGQLKIQDISILSDHYALATFTNGQNAGQMLLRHKTRHASFVLGTWLAHLRHPRA